MKQRPASQPVKINLLTKSVALIIVLALAAPLFFVGRFGPVSAQTKKPKRAAANAAPPLPYDFSSKSPGWHAGTLKSISDATQSFSDYVFAPALPEGFESAQPVSPLYKSVSSTIEGLTGSPKVSASTLAAGDIEFDFDNDGKADVSRWNPGSAEYKVKKSNGGAYETVTVGTSSAVPVPGDFDGNGITDYASFNAGSWKIKTCAACSATTVSWGTTGDVPVVGDYDGDGKSDHAIVRTTAGVMTWWILKSSGGYTSTVFGQSGDILAQGNYDGDSKTDIAVYRAGVWHVQGSTAGYYTFGWGVATDTPVQADYDADGKTDFAVFRPSTGTWWVYESNGGGSYLTFNWGNFGDQPVPADYDGDNKADYAIWRPTTGVWYIHKSSTGTFEYETLGMSGDVPAEAAYLKKVGSLQSDYDFAKDRLSPINATGGTNLYSRNFSWGSGLVGLPGRAGLNAGFGISYNSLVWTKDTENDVMVFDADVSNVSPGFRMGFATIEPVYWDSTNGRFSYLMITPSGARVEFQQIGATNQYETVDSSYALLETIGAKDPNDPVEAFTIDVTTTDGTKTAYEWKAGAFRAKEIKDSNGNYITISHDDYGLLDTVTDTLGRVITVNYDNEFYPTTITQSWKTSNGSGSAVTHTYATFTYTDISVDPDFASTLGVFGPDGGTNVKSLTKVTYADLSSTEFAYNAFGQVEKVTNKATDGHTLNYTSTNLDTPGTNLADVPRFTVTRSWVENFNLVSGTEQETVYTNTFTTGQTIPDVGGTGTRIQVSMTGHPTSNTSKTYVGETGWMESLLIISEDWADSGSGLERKRWSTTDWTQDDENLSYILNPRVTETNIGDDENSMVRRSTTEYKLYPSSTVSEYGLVDSVSIYDTDQSTVLKKVETDYNLSSAYTDRRIIGLPSEVRGYGYENSQLALVSKVTYGYDEENFSQETNQTPAISTGHDTTNYGSAFIAGRANPTSATRHDITGQTSSVTSKTRYDIAGSPVASLDPLNRKVRTEYTDNFNDTPSDKNTFAYPTKLIDPMGKYSLVEYRFDTGANVWADSPHPSGTGRGKETTRLYDSLGRLERQTLVNTGAYTRYVYPWSQNRSEVYTTIVDTTGNGVDSGDEVLSESLFDGAGRTLESRTEHPGSTGGWAGSIAEYNILGQLKRSTVPTEITSSYTPAGDDASQGWLWKEQEYDWNGRVVREINTDGTDRLISYSGCGCAGVTEATIESEVVPRDDDPGTARRKEKVYTDILGRKFKTEMYKWTGGVYTTTVQTYNGRDQILITEQFEGTDNPANTKQTVTMTYDGHGRMKTRRYPIEDSNSYTEWAYNQDDTIDQITDPRLAITEFTYTAQRGLLEKIEYTPAFGMLDTPDVTYTYDALGNRTSMTDGTGNTNYTYDGLSRLTNESKYFDELPSAPVTNNRYDIGYTYNLAGGLETITDPFGYTVTYSHDSNGRLSEVDGDATTNNPTGNYAKNIKYRAFGAIKQMDYDLPNEVSQIKMEFDNRLRIDHSEVTSPSETGGYLLKADYEYSADSRIKAKDDLIRDHLDQTSKFDFAGRLVFNQFPMVENNDNLNVRLYEQTIVYDAFSMMTSRQGEHWGTGIGFTETYLNGRIQNKPGMVYDASGNITKTGATHSPHDFQETEFDAAGRRVEFLSSVKARWGSLLNMVTESKTVHEYDGNGRPVKEEVGYQYYHAVNDPPPQNPPATSVTAFQVWSSVLGQRLTKLVPDGSKWQTYITAGDAAIAIDDVQTGILSWKTADPVTGTSAEFSYNSSGAGRSVKEYEPLGQEVSINDPAELPDPPPNESVSHWQDMEWQCNLPLGWYGAFVSTPVHCMIPIAQSRFYVSNVGKPEPWSFANSYSSTSSSFAASRVAYALPGYREDDGWYGRDADWNDWRRKRPEHPDRVLTFEAPNANCMLNLVNKDGKSATQLARDFDPNGHKGRHTVSPVILEARESKEGVYGGDVIAVPALDGGKIIRWGFGGDSGIAKYIDIQLTNGMVARLEDFTALAGGNGNDLRINSPKPWRGLTKGRSYSVNDRRSIAVKTGDDLGTIGPAQRTIGGTIMGDGLHLTLIMAGKYDAFLTAHSRGQDRTPFLLDPLGTESPFRCPLYSGEIINQGPKRMIP